MKASVLANKTSSSSTSGSPTHLPSMRRQVVFSVCSWLVACLSSTAFTSSFRASQAWALLQQSRFLIRCSQKNSKTLRRLSLRQRSLEPQHLLHSLRLRSANCQPARTFLQLKRSTSTRLSRVARYLQSSPKTLQKSHRSKWTHPPPSEVQLQLKFRAGTQLRCTKSSSLTQQCRPWTRSTRPCHRSLASRSMNLFRMPLQALP